MEHADEDDADTDARRPSINDISRNEVLAAIRELYHMDPRPCDRECLLKLLRAHLGFGVLGSNIRAALSGDIQAAVRRGILECRGGQYHRLCGSIDQYESVFLREMFLASLGDQRSARVWIDQDEAIVNAARYLGFKSTRDRIRRQFKTAIHTLIRNGTLERDGTWIRRI
jgi:hypothetical protein